MKDSGIEWIGMIPRTWSRCEIKYYCKDIFPGATPQSNNPDYWDGDINWIPSGSCHDCRIYTAPKKITQAGYENSSTKLIPANTALVAMTGATCGNTGYLTIESCANQSVTAFIEDKTRCDSVFLWYVLRAAKEHLLTFQSGGAQGGVNVENCKSIVVPFVPLEEQRQIAEFLDRKCAEIDSVIADTQRTIEEYKALKQSIITEAVTKGVRGKRPMKDSGIEYCDAIPDEWSITRMAFSNWIRARLGWKGLKAEEYVDIGYPFLSAFNIINDKLVWCNLNHITQERYDESPEIKLSIGDILLVKDGAGIGKCGRIDELPLGEATVNSSLAVITPNENLYYKYEYYYFLCDAFQKVIMVLRNGMGVPHLTQEIMKGIRLPLPSKEEQIEIAEYLDTKCAEVDRIISAKEQLLTELESYKKSVIYEYVTGKKEVPACQ